jgi:hypothetical protein
MGRRRARARCAQSDEDKIGRIRRISVHDLSCRVSHGGNQPVDLPDRCAAEAAIHSPFQPEGEKLWKGETERETGVTVSVGPEAAGRVACMSVARGEASGQRPARAGIPRGSMTTLARVDAQKAAEFYLRLVI